MLGTALAQNNGGANEDAARHDQNPGKQNYETTTSSYLSD